MAPKKRWKRWQKITAGILAASAIGIGAITAGPRAIQKYREYQVNRNYQAVVHSIKQKKGIPPGVQRTPTQPEHFSPREIPEKGDYCSLYARLVAERIFWKAYVPGNAWELSQRNRSIWKRDPQSPQTRMPSPSVGHMVGIFNPGSSHNEQGIPYTHVGIVVGYQGGEPLIMHRVGPTDRMETLNDALHLFSKPNKFNPKGKPAQVMEIIAPRSE